MTLRLTRVKGLLALAVAALSSHGLAATAQRAADSKDAILFAVSATLPENPTIDPIVVVRKGRFVEPSSSDGMQDDPLKSFAENYYRAGRTYRLLSGGGDAGTLVVRKSNLEGECFRTGAGVELKSPVKLGAVVMALATDSETLGRAARPSRRAPTDEERAAAVALAESAFRQKRVPASALRSMKTINLTAADVDADGRAELVGSFVVKNARNQRRLLFLVAEPAAGKFKIALARHNLLTAQDMMNPEVIDNAGEGGFLSEVFVDHLDTDGDGASEIVSMSTSFEGVAYRIYSRRRGAWVKAYEAYVYRCAY